MESLLRQRHKSQVSRSGDKFWRDDYGILIRKPGNVIPPENDSVNERFNSYTRFSIIVVIAMALMLQSPYVLLLIPIGLVAISMIYDVVMKETEVEKYGETVSKDGADYIVKTIDGIKCRAPTEHNPFMTPNYLVDPPEILQLPACSSISKDALAEGRKLYDDRTPYDIDNAVSGTDESARRFFAMYTIGSWPPETELFAKWLNGIDYPEQKASDGYDYSCHEHDDSAPRYKYSCRA